MNQQIKPAEATTDASRSPNTISFLTHAGVPVDFRKNRLVLPAMLSPLNTVEQFHMASAYFYGGDTTLQERIQCAVEITLSEDRRTADIRAIYSTTDTPHAPLSEELIIAVTKTAFRHGKEENQTDMMDQLRQSELQKDVEKIADCVMKTCGGKRFASPATIEFNGVQIGKLPAGTIAQKKKTVTEESIFELIAIIVVVGASKRRLKYQYGKERNASFDVRKLLDSAAEALKGSPHGRKVNIKIKRSIFSDDSYEDEVLSVEPI